MSFQNGLISVLGLGELWNSQTIRPTVHVRKRRVHHYEVGIVLFCVGAVLKMPTLAGFGAGLFLHDIDDVSL